MLRKKATDILALASIFTAVLFFFFRFVFPSQQLLITPDFGQSDAVTGFATKFIYSDAIRQHIIPFWSAKIGGGYPIYANGGMGVWYIPNLVFFYMLPVPLAYTCSLAFSMFLLGWGMYIWIRCIGLSRISSIFGALSCALSGYVIVQFTHLTIVQSISIFPWIIAMCHLIITRRNRIYMPILSILFSQLIFIGFAQSIFITCIAVFAYSIWLSTRQHILIPSLVNITLAILFGILASAIHLLPAFEFLGQLQSNGVFGSDTATLFSYPVSHVLTLLNPYALGNPANGTYPHFFEFNGSIFWENTAYIGIIPLIFCVYAIAKLFATSKQKNSEMPYSMYVLFFACAALGAFFLMLGRNSPLYFIYTFYPFTLFRVPSRFIWLFIISLIMIASIMMDQILLRIQQKRTRILIGIFIVVLHVFNILYLFSGYHNLESAKEWLSTPTLAEYLQNGNTITIGGEIAFNSAYLRNGWDTVESNERPSYMLRNTFTPDKNLLWDVSQIKDYSGREFKRTKIMNDLLSQTITTGGGYATISAVGEKLLSLYGISNIISTLQLSQKTLIQKAVLSDPRTHITLFHNMQSLPKAYIATETITVHTIKEAVAALISDSFVLGNTALVDRQMSASISGKPAEITIVAKQDGKYEYELTPVDHESLIVTTENYYPGWNAIIDGKPGTVFPVNVSQIGILAPKHAKHIILRFEPTDFQRGAAISIAALVILVIVVVYLLFV